MCPRVRALWRHLVNMIELVLPSATRVHNPNSKLIGSATFAQPTAVSPYTLQCAHLSPKIAPSRRGIWTPFNTWFLGPSELTNQIAFRSVQQFLHRWLQSVPMLNNGMPLPPWKLSISMGASGPHLIHGSLGPPKSSTQTASQSLQPFLQGSLVWQTDRETHQQTDRPTDRPCCSVGNNRPHPRT